MKVNLKNLAVILTGVLFTGQVSAQLLDSSSLDQSADQAQGNYQQMNMSYAGFSSLGMIQSAWQDPLQNLGEGQSKPAYSKYYWSPDLVLPIRLREGMMTLVNFPEWELLEDVYIGDTRSFNGSISGPNTLLLFPADGAAVGVDTNIVVFGRSGNKYVFYLRSEGVNTEKLTNSIIDIDVVGDTDTSGGSPSSSSGMVLGGGGSSSHVNANRYRGNGAKSVDSTFTKRFLKEDWLKSIPLDPTKFKFDIEIYVPNPDDVVIAPERVWHDDIFTYIDLGEKALNMIQRPIVTLIIERSETPVGFRTKGPNNRLIIVEGVGDMVMRSGKRMVCLKMRRSDDDGLQYVTYADTSDEWDIGPKIPGVTGGSGKNSSAEKGNNAEKVNNVYGQGQNGAAQSGASSEEVLKFNPDGTISRPGYGGVYVPNGVPGGSLGDIDCSNMYHIDRTNGGNMQNPYPQYKYGSGFNGQNGESLSIELGTDSNVGNLELLWKDLSGRYGTVLSGYEPFYSVDAPADGQGKELFHLRVGPVKNLETGDSVCSQLGRSGVFCSVVRVQ
ncbi:MAG: TrbG/VirB9 family P-type conjugative transfer protein [Alphaproteobacteria bacterium]|nr:TrbG/VirB9 family P-type conjugative transfer protein [Alphaproteobacteria bacterium]